MAFFLILLATILIGVMLGSLMWGIVAQRVVPPLRTRDSGGPLKVGVVLGSGGHTSEMMRILKALPHSHWENSQPFYVVSNTDQHSAQLARDFERSSFKRGVILNVIPRAREVGQSYFTSVWTTLLAFWSSLKVVYREKPCVLLTNGPGVCLPVILAGFLLPAWCPWYGRRRPIVVYLESFTCVEHLSLTGKLLAPFLADIFTVHWEAAQVAAARIRWRGQLYCIGNKTKRNENAAEPALHTADAHQVASLHQQTMTGGHALVTVGSTRFDELIYAVSDTAVCKTLQVHFGIDKLLLQYGAMDFKPPTNQPMKRYDDPVNAPGGVWRGTSGGVVIEAFAYRPKLEQYILNASLVITHAGAGTILECLNARCPTIVVPNRRLMSDHQLELANALMHRGYLYCVSLQQLCGQLQTLDLSKLSVYPGIDEDLLIAALTSPPVQNKNEFEK
ncbi:unnamed protein product [Phytomonas sp. EM1]|nr:unnamed protein product [Phytomonas sp. EM1]|eukprot:CCW61741.1 unnamed protein product [Phytomonas sp. isolate EM1]